MKEDPIELSGNHAVIEDYKQRMRVSDWRRVLLEDRDTVIFRGIVRRLVGESIGCGVVEVYKVPLDNEFE